MENVLPLEVTVAAMTKGGVQGAINTWNSYYMVFIQTDTI
jgi:hypothetical protein